MFKQLDDAKVNARLKDSLGAVKIIHAGPLTTLQDLGRRGSQSLGFCQSGAADEYSFLWANTLLDNKPDSPALEICFGPFECEFEKSTIIAVTGTQATLQINNDTYDGWGSFRVRAGDRLKIFSPVSGVYTYLAIKQGFLLENSQSRFFGSVAMVPREMSGPFAGKNFQSGDECSLRYQEYRAPSPKCAREYYSHTQQRRVHWQHIPNDASILELGLFLSYQSQTLSTKSLERLFNEKYKVGVDSNKMGYRLEGDAIHFDQRSLLSEGVAYGAVQVPPDGQPIILLKDRQTIGGYPKVGCICLMDAFRLSQRRPGQEVRFKPVEIEHRATEMRRWLNFFSKNEK